MARTVTCRCCVAVNAGPVTVEACAVSVNGDCCGMWRGQIQVVYCPATNDTDDFYLYKLIPSVTCDSAYCAVARSDVLPPTATPTTG